MQVEDTFRVFNDLSVVFGVAIFLKSKTYRIINFFRAACVILASLYLLCTYHEKVSNVEVQSEWFWTIMFEVMYDSSVIIYTIVLNAKRSQIAGVLTTFFESMSRKEKMIVKRTSTVLSIYVVIHLIGLILSYLFSKTYNVIEVVILNQTEPYMHGLSFYFILILSSFYCHRNTLNEIKDQCLVQSRKPSMDNIREAIKKLIFIQNNMKSLNQSMGPALVLVFFYILIGVPMEMYLQVTSPLAKDPSYIIELFAVILVVVISSMLIVICETFSSRLDKIRNDILNNVIDLNKVAKSHHLQLFLDLLRDPHLFTFTAMDMFNMSYGMIMYFLGTLISMGVLICQVGTSLNGNNTVTRGDLDNLRQHMEELLTNFTAKNDGIRH